VESGFANIYDVRIVYLLGAGENEDATQIGFRGLFSCVGASTIGTVLNVAVRDYCQTGPP